MINFSYFKINIRNNLTSFKYEYLSQGIYCFNNFEIMSSLNFFYESSEYTNYSKVNYEIIGFF